MIIPGDAPLVTAEMLEDLVAAHTAGGADVTLLALTSPTPLPYGRIVRDENGKSRGSSRRGTQPTRSGPSKSSTPPTTSSTPRRSVVRWSSSTQTTRRASSTSPTRSRASSRPEAARSRTAPKPTRSASGREHARRARPGRRRPPRPDQRGAPAGRRHDRRSADGLDRRLASSSRPTPPSSRSPSSRARRVLRPAPRSVRTRSRIDAEIGPSALVGPFCYLRPGTVLAAGAKAGTFVEIKNTHVGERSKVPHLSYIGDADIGEDSNIGAGAITANFPHEPDQPKSDEDRQERQDWGPQCIHCSGRHWRRFLDGGGDRRHRRRPPRIARWIPAAAGQRRRATSVQSATTTMLS